MPAWLSWKKTRTAKSRAAIAVLAAALCFPGVGHAQSGFYGSASGSVNVSGSGEIEATTPIGGKVTLDNGHSGEVSVGYRWDGGWRIEATAMHSGADIEPNLLLDPGGSVATTSVMLGAYKEFGPGPIKPYLGASAGLGWMRLRANSNALVVPAAVDDRDTVVALRVGAGAVVALSGNVDLDVGYRFTDLSGYNGTGLGPAGGGGIPSVPMPVKAGFSSHALTAGLRVSF